MTCNPSTSSLAHKANIYFVASQRAQSQYSLHFGEDLKIVDNRRIETEIVTTAPEKKKTLHMAALHFVTV